MISVGTASATPQQGNTTDNSAAREASADPAKSPTTTPVQDAAKDIIGVKDNTPMPVEPLETAATEPVKPTPTVVAPKAVPELSHAELCTTIAAAAERHDLPVTVLANLIWQESRFRPQARSPVGALGIAQFMPAVAKEVGLENPFNPLEAVPAAARFLSSLVEKFGSIGLATAAYNAGPGRVGAWIRGKSLPKETRDYVRIITGHPAEHWRTRNGRNAVFAMAKGLPCRQLATFAKYEQADVARHEQADLPEQRQVAEQARANVMPAAYARSQRSPAIVSLKTALASRRGAKVVIAKATVENARPRSLKAATTAKQKVASRRGRKGKIASKRVRTAEGRRSGAEARRGKSRVRAADHRRGKSRVRVASER